MRLEAGRNGIIIIASENNTTRLLCRESNSFCKRNMERRKIRENAAVTVMMLSY